MMNYKKKKEKKEEDKTVKNSRNRTEKKALIQQSLHDFKFEGSCFFHINKTNK